MPTIGIKYDILAGGVMHMESIDVYLADIEQRIIPEQERRILDQWRQFAEGKWSEEVFQPAREEKAPPTVEWPEIRINDALEHDDLMIVDQFSKVSALLENGGGGLLTVRSNFGVGILPSLFGAPRFVMPYEHNTLPNVRSLPGGLSAIKNLIDRGIPSLDAGYGADVFRIGERYLDIFSRYPKISEFVRVDHPDCQGPMDICELLWGSELFTAIYDYPDVLQSLLRIVTDTYKAYMEKWFSLIPPQDELHAYFGNAHLGTICIRDDSAMNLSPDVFEEFILPYDQELLSHFKGGSIHFCGKGDHFVPFFPDMEGLKAMNMSQPEYNDMEKIYRSTVDRGIPIFALSREAVQNALDNGRPLRGLVHAG